MKKIIKFVFWFSTGAFLGLFFFVSFGFIVFQKLNNGLVYPGITIDGIDVGGKSEKEIEDFFAQKNDRIGNSRFVLSSEQDTVTLSAKELNFGYDQKTLAKQAIILGRSENLLSNISIIIQAYMNGVNLPPLYYYSEDKLMSGLSSIIEKIYIEPVDALFNFQNGKVVTFRPSSDGQTVDIDLLKSQLKTRTLEVMSAKEPKNINLIIPIKVLKPRITTDSANSLGIKELLAEGKSLFKRSIANRIYNINLASTRLNGILVAPDEVFSFNNALGDVSAFTGYKQAYIIQGGKTVLGDGGGVCQVSTTLFRSLLNAGIPIIERHAHSYRVGYYEQDSPPGFDATVYSPTVDLKFKNDTGNHILIQASIDPNTQELSFSLYGTKDGRETSISKPVIANLTPAPADVYQDDPTLSKGTTKQVDFKADGTSVFFTREVIKNGKVIISDKFISNYVPWASVYLRGTKE